MQVRAQQRGDDDWGFDFDEPESRLLPSPLDESLELRPDETPAPAAIPRRAASRAAVVAAFLLLTAVEVAWLVAAVALFLWLVR